MVVLDKIYCSEEQIERANKALRLNGGSDYDYDPGFRLLAASSFTSNRKPTLKIKRLRSGAGTGPVIKLKGASNSNPTPNSNIQRQLLERQRRIGKDYFVSIAYNLVGFPGIPIPEAVTSLKV